MITEADALRKAKDAYINIWGVEWVRSHSKTITAVYGAKRDGYHVAFYQDAPRAGNEIIIGGSETRGIHETHFVFDNETDEMRMLEHF